MVKDSVNFCQQTHRRSEFPADSNGEFSLESVRTEHLSFWPLLQLLQRSLRVEDVSAYM